MFRKSAIIWYSSLLWLGVILVSTLPVDAKIQIDTSGNGGMVSLQGDINREDVTELNKILESKKLKFNFLALNNSAGGDAYAAMDLGRILRKNNFSVWAFDKCFSACALVYIAGVDRENFGVIGLHRPYFAGAPMPTAQVGAALQKMLADIKKYVSEMNVTDEFNSIMVNTDPADMRTYVKREIETIVPKHDPQYDELMAAYWARVYGVSTEEFRRRKAFADANCYQDNNSNKPSGLNGLVASQSCTFAVYWGLSVPVFEARFIPALQMCPQISDNDARSLLMSASTMDNPILIQNETCMRKAMLAAEQPVRFVINPQFHLALSFHEGLARVDDGYFHSGFIDKQGKFVIKPQFVGAGSFQDGLAAAQTGDGKTDKYGTPTGKWGVIDKQGRFVIKPQFNSLDGSFQNGLAAVEVGDKWGFIDKQGKFVIQPQYDWAGSFQDGLAPVNVALKWGFIDAQGKFVIKPQFKRAHEFQDGLAAVAVADKSGAEKLGFIDKQGKFVIRPQFDEVEPFQEGVAAVGFANPGWQWGFIDKQGKFIIKPRFDWAESYQNGMAAVKVNDKWGFVDKQGEFVISPQFEWADSYSEGLARVEVGGKWGYISR